MREENRSLFFFAPFPPSQFRLSLRPPFVSDRDKTATTFSGHFLISELAVCTTLLIVNEELAVKTRNCI